MYGVTIKNIAGLETQFTGDDKVARFGVTVNPNIFDFTFANVDDNGTTGLSPHIGNLSQDITIGDIPVFNETHAGLQLTEIQHSPNLALKGFAQHVIWQNTRIFASDGCNNWIGLNKKCNPYTQVCIRG